MPTQKDIAAGKRRFVALYRQYSAETAHLTCGNTLALYIRPDLKAMVDEINEIAAWLRQNDPEFPSTWRPL